MYTHDIQRDRKKSAHAWDGVIYRVRIDGGMGFNPSSPVHSIVPPLPPIPSPLVPAVLLTLPVHFSQFEPWLYMDSIPGPWCRASHSESYKVKIIWGGGFRVWTMACLNTGLFYLFIYFIP